MPVVWVGDQARLVHEAVRDAPEGPLVVGVGRARDEGADGEGAGVWARLGGEAEAAEASAAAGVAAQAHGGGLSGVGAVVVAVHGRTPRVRDLVDLAVVRGLGIGGRGEAGAVPGVGAALAVRLALLAGPEADGGGLCVVGAGGGCTVHGCCARG